MTGHGGIVAARQHVTAPYLAEAYRRMKLPIRVEFRWKEFYLRTDDGDRRLMALDAAAAQRAYDYLVGVCDGADAPAVVPVSDFSSSGAAA